MFFSNHGHHMKVLLSRFRLCLEGKHSSLWESEGQTRPFFIGQLEFFGGDFFGFTMTETHTPYLLGVNTHFELLLLHTLPPGDGESVHSRTYRINRQSGFPVVALSLVITAFNASQDSDVRVPMKPPCVSAANETHSHGHVRFPALHPQRLFSWVWIKSERKFWTKIPPL